MLSWRISNTFKLCLAIWLANTSVSFATHIEEQNFQGVSRVVFKNFGWDVRIKTQKFEESDALGSAASPTAQLRFSGKNLVDDMVNVNITHEDGVLTLTDKQPTGFQSMHSVFGNVWDANSRIIVNGVDITSQAQEGPVMSKLEMTLVGAVPLSIDAWAGDWDVGNLAAPFKAHITGSASVNAKNIEGNVNVSLNSTESFEAEHIKSEQAVLASKSTGSIAIGAISARNVTLQSKSVGRVFIENLKVEDTFDANVSGTGHTVIQHLEGNDVSLLSRGVGNIRINGGTVSTMRAHTKGVGGIMFEGTAKTANLETTGVGNIRIKRVLDTLTQTSSGVGRVTVTNVPQKDSASPASQKSSVPQSSTQRQRDNRDTRTGFTAAGRHMGGQSTVTGNTVQEGGSIECSGGGIVSGNVVGKGGRIVSRANATKEEMDAAFREFFNS